MGKDRGGMHLSARDLAQNGALDSICWTVLPATETSATGLPGN